MGSAPGVLAGGCVVWARRRAERGVGACRHSRQSRTMLVLPLTHTVRPSLRIPRSIVVRAFPSSCRWRFHRRHGVSIVVIDGISIVVYGIFIVVDGVSFVVDGVFVVVDGVFVVVMALFHCHRWRFHRLRWRSIADLPPCAAPHARGAPRAWPNQHRRERGPGELLGRQGTDLSN